MKFTAKERAEAFKQMQAEWNDFRVPDPIHARIEELFWEHCEREETVKTLMQEFGMKECFVRKCYFFSEANRITRERLAAIGMLYNCSWCTEQCVPKSLREQWLGY